MCYIQTGGDNTANNAKNVGNINGMSDEIDGSCGKSVSPAKPEKQPLKEQPPAVDSSSAKTAPVTPATPVINKATPEQNVFNVNIHYDNTDLVYFSVEKQDVDKAGTASSDKSQSVEDSVHSASELSIALPKTSSNSSEAAPAPTNQTLEKTRQEVKGTVKLCEFIIDHFEKV